MKQQWFPAPRYLLRKNIIKFILSKEKLIDKKCLEIGYGSGDMLNYFNNLGLKTYGYDFSSTAYKIASNNFKNGSTNSITLLKDKVDIENHKFDFIFAFEVLEHIKNDKKTLEEWIKLLKKGGKLFISVPAHKSKWGYNDIISGHIRRYEKKELSRLITESGLKLEKIWNYGFPLTLLLDPLNNSYKNKEQKGKNLQKLTKKSFCNKNNLFVKLISNKLFLYPFFILQRFFLNKDYGSAYITVSKNIKQNT